MEVEPPVEARGEPDYGGLRIVDGEIEMPPIDVPEAVHSVATYEKDGPRLMITHIVNDNFKSYAGLQTLGPFHKCFSAIVGPNGSGKSNVIDSMLFVFGYRANKIRSKKISVLIHNSQDHQGLTSCSVAVHFQKIIDTGTGEDEYEVVPNSRFSVQRTAFKDNSSYYKINDKKATYKEVAFKLRGNGIDLDHNRFLILQGEVEQIAMMKPKALTEHDEGMLEFLEDIIGSSRFKEPISLLYKRVEALNEMRGEKLNRVKVVEKEKDDLEGAKNEAVEFLTLENEIVKKKNVMFSKYILECAENQQKAVKKRDGIAEGMKGVTDKLNELADRKKTIGKEHKKIYKQYEELEKLCEETKEKFTAFEQQDVRCREDLKHSKGKKKKLDKILDQEKKKLEDLLLLPEKAEKEVASLEKKREQLDKDKEKEEGKLAEVMESLKTETAGLQEEKEGKERELVELQKGVNETKSVMSVAQSEHELYLKNLNSEKSKLADTERNLNKAADSLKERQSSVKDLEKKIPEAEKALGKAKKDLQTASEAEAQISEKVRAARVKVEEARSSQQAASHKGQVIDALMKLKKSGKIPGIYGRLGDLGAIDEKYDVAISTACGPLDDIVVDTIDSAQKCVEFLKQNRVGRGTFIGLDKQQRWLEQTRRKITTPENVPRLFDLIQVKDPSVLPAFYFALRDTLVAKDLDQATRIAYGRTRYRVVTLGGQLIDQSGTMSGGGGRVSKGRMGSSIVQEIDPKVLQTMAETLQKDTTEAQNCRENKFRLQETVDRLTRSLHEMKHSLDKYQLEIQSLTEQVESLKAQKKEQEQRVKAAAPDEKTLKDLEKKVNVYRKEFEKARDGASQKEDEVHELHKQIMDIGGSKLSAAETRVNMVSKNIDKITGEITKANVSIKTSHRNAKKTTEKVRNIEEEIQDCKATIEKLEKEFKDLEEQATSVLQSYEGAQTKMRDVDHELQDSRKAVAGLEEQEQSLQKENIEIKHELEKYEGVVKENQAKLKHWKKETGKLELHKIERDEAEKLPEIPPETLADVDTDNISYEITMLEEKLAKMKPNMTAITEYRKKEGQYLKRVAELDKITDMRDGQRKMHEDLRSQRQDEFMVGFSTITGKLKEMYQMITLGGDAELELVDSLDPFSEGVVFSVRPPKKSWKNISNLSGGEKTLSSLALVFALHHYKPTPLYVMDEIDAALDFKNVSIVANYIKERTKNAQFIIISLRNNMFELADRLIGIYKTYNCTKSVTINPTKISMIPEIPEASASSSMSIAGTSNTTLQPQAQPMAVA